jgi:hypothetical protein
MASRSQSAGEQLRKLERAAVADHARTGIPHCLVKRHDEPSPVTLPETEVIAAGLALIDCIIWSSDTCESDGLDPALLA